MRYVIRSLLVLCFLFLLGFAIRNTSPVELNFLLGISWQAPLIIILLAFFAAGVVIGLLAALGTVVRLHRDLNSARAALARREEVAASTPPSQADKAAPVSPEVADAGML